MKKLWQIPPITFYALLFLLISSGGSESENPLFGTWKGHIEIHFDLFVYPDILIDEPLTITISADSIILTISRGSYVGTPKSSTGPKLAFTSDLYGFVTNFLGVRDNQKIKGTARIPDLNGRGYWEIKKESP